MLSLFKNWLARKELAELDRIKSTLQEYRRWLAEFPMIRMVLENLLTEVEGKESLDACHPPLSKGPWTVDNLRHRLRKIRDCKDAGDEVLRGLEGYGPPSNITTMDADWRREFDKKHEAMIAAQTQAKELQAKLDEAAGILVEKNREVNTLRLLCGEAYQVVGAQDKPNRKALDSLYAASAGEPIPFMEFHE